jgi:hypothetical protein
VDNPELDCPESGDPRLVHDPFDVLGCHPFTLSRAESAGLSEDDIRHLLDTGGVRRVMRGVYVAAGVADNLELRASAVALIAPAGTVVCGRTGAWLLGVDAMAMGAHRTLPDVDAMVIAGRAASRRTGVFGSSGPLREQDVVYVGGVPVTPPARTAADLARLLPRPDALASLDAMLRLGVTSVDEIRDVLGEFAGYRGVAQARELTSLASPLAESPQESRTRLRCVDAGFPAPEPQIVVRRADGLFVARLDMGWREVRRGLEFDGDEHHSSASDQAHDRRRRLGVESTGWGLAVVTTREVLGRHLDFECIVADLLQRPYELTRHHPSRGGWEGRGRVRR